ncbi:MAG: helix-turn-helix domain-containing protein [Tepidisphaeraceae bacterium]|jgi:hypothetical protein
MAKKLPSFMDTTAAAVELGVSPRRVLQFITSGRLPAQMMGGVYIVLRADLAKVANRKPGRPWSKDRKQAPSRTP